MPIEIPYELPGIERAKLELAGIREEYTKQQRAVFDLAAKTEQGKRAFDELTTAFAKGTVSAKEVRESLAALAAQAPRTAAEIAKEAKEAEAAAKKQQDAFERLEEKRRHMTNGLRDTSLASGRVNEAMASGGARVIGLGQAFGVAAVGVAAATAGLVKFGEAAAVGERQAAALRDLGSTYHLVSEATNDTLTATDVLAARQTFLNSRLRISGEELAVVARYARDHKQATMTDAEAVERFSEALRGGEQDALQEWGIAVQSGATRAQTFERALRTMRHEQENTAPAARTLAEDTDRLKSALEEGGGALARMFSEGLGVQSIISDLATGVRGLAQDLNELLDIEERAPREAAAWERRRKSMDDYTAALRSARQEAERAGLTPDAARRALPGVNPNQLTDEQREAATRRMQALVTNVAARRGPAATADTIAAGAHDAMAFGTGRTSFNISTDDASLDAMAAGLQAARSTRRGGDVRAAQDRAELQSGLGSLGRELETQIEANLAAQRAAGRTPPRDGAAQGAAQSQLDQQAIQALQRRISLARQGYQDEREALTATNTLREREVALQVRSARGEVQQFEVETYQRLQRQEDLRASITLEARQLRELQTLRESLAAQRERTTSAAQQRALDDQIHTLREDELRLSREIATQQHDILDTEEEQARAVRSRAEAFQREREQKDRAAPDRSDAGMFLARQRERELAREDRLQEGRLERMRSFTDRWRELHEEQVDVTAQAMGSISHAIDTGGEAIGGAWEQIVTGQKDVADAFQDSLKGFLLSVAKREAIEGGTEIAKGLSALAGIVTAPLAPGHFAAAAAHFAVAAATGVAGAAVPASAASAKGSSGGSSAPRERPLQREQDARGGSGGNTYNFVFGGGVIGTPRELAGHFADIMNDPSTGFRLSPRRVQE